MASEHTDFTFGLDQNRCKIKHTSCLENKIIIIAHRLPCSYSLVLTRLAAICPQMPPLLCSHPCMHPYPRDCIHRRVTPAREVLVLRSLSHGSPPHHDASPPWRATGSAIGPGAGRTAKAAMHCQLTTLDPYDP
jgi:hypothetical protein